jgi:hypothetical protein
VSVITVNTLRTSYDLYDWVLGPISNRIDGEIGRLYFHNEPYYRFGEIAYHLFRPYRGQGYMSEVLRGLLYELKDNYFHDIGLVYARVIEGNMESRHLLLRHGFTECDPDYLLQCYPTMRIPMITRKVYFLYLMDELPFPDSRIDYVSDGSNRGIISRRT